MWECRNDPEARAFSGNPAAIPYLEHETWFAKLLKSGSRHLWIAETEGQDAVGYGRLDGQTISVAVHPLCRRLGFGREIIALTTQQGKGRILAYIKPENVASQRAFASCGYCLASIEPGLELWTYDP